MNVDERIRELLDGYPSPSTGDGRALYLRGRRRLRTRRVVSVAASVAVVAIAAGAALQLLPSDELPTPVIVIMGLPGLDEQPERSPACVELADDTADVVVRVAEHAARQAGGIPGEVFAVEYADIWQLADRLAAGDPQLQRAVAAIAVDQEQQACQPGFAYPEVAQRARAQVDQQREALAADPDVVTYATVNLLVVLAAEFAPPAATQPVPDGIPATFPVHPDAQLLDHTADDVLATASWQITGTDLEEVANLFHEWLTEPLAGGWEVVASDGRRTHHPDGRITGRARLEITGYGTAGQLYIDTADTRDLIDITVELRNAEVP